MKKLLATLSITCILAVIGFTLPTFASNSGDTTTSIKRCQKTNGHSSSNIVVKTDCLITYEDGEPVLGETLSPSKEPTGRRGKVTYCGCDMGVYSFSDGSSHYHFN